MSFKILLQKNHFAAGLGASAGFAGSAGFGGSAGVTYLPTLLYIVLHIE